MLAGRNGRKVGLLATLLAKISLRVEFYLDKSFCSDYKRKRDTIDPGQCVYLCLTPDGSASKFLLVEKKKKVTSMQNLTEKNNLLRYLLEVLKQAVVNQNLSAQYIYLTRYLKYGEILKNFSLLK